MNATEDEINTDLGMIKLSQKIIYEDASVIEEMKSKIAECFKKFNDGYGNLEMSIALIMIAKNQWLQ